MRALVRSRSPSASSCCSASCCATPVTRCRRIACSPRSGATTSIRARTSSMSMCDAFARSSAPRRSSPFEVWGTGSMQPDRFDWPNRLRWWDIAWVLFSLANLYAMLLWPEWETVPFHFIWVSLTILYGFRVWRARPTTMILAFVMVLTGTLIWIDVSRDVTSLDELTEVPLMAAMFVAMVWHARRRLTAMEETERVSLANLRLLERQRRFVQDASHELRTPITVALGHAELIQRRTVDPTIGQDAAVISDELMRLRRLADRLLLLASSEDLEVPQTAPIGVEQLVVEAMNRWAATP